MSRKKETQQEQVELIPAEGQNTETALATRHAERAVAPVDGTPASLLRIAVEGGADVEKLERLMALQERYEARQAEQAYFGAMNRAQGEMTPIVKDKFNQQTKSRYATLEAVHSVVTPIATKHGFAISYSEDKAEQTGYIRIVADVMHASGHHRKYWIDLALDNKGMAGAVNKTEVHGKGSTISYGRRYLEMQIFNLTVSDEDTDGNKPDEVVTQDQYAVLQELIEASGADVGKFCAAFGAKSLAEFPQSKYESGRAGLKEKMDRKNKGAA